MTEHPMRLHPEPFDQLLAGTKTVELRLDDARRRRVAVGDVIVFTRQPDEQATLRARVVALHRHPSFAALIAAVGPAACGLPADAPIDPAWMRAYYSAEDEARLGVVGIELVVLSGTDGGSGVGG